MKIVFDIERLVPRFILADRNGYAVAKAIERAFQIAAEAAQRGLEIIQDPDKMPEWRLDELAGELGCLYDYNGAVEQKRFWIKNATYLYTIFGTPQAMRNYLEGYLQTVEMEEWWEYEGDPFHFRINMFGDWTTARQAWVTAAVEQLQNVRSVLDGIAYHMPNDAERNMLYAGIALYGRPRQEMAATEQPDLEEMDFLTDEADAYLTDESNVGMTE